MSQIALVVHLATVASAMLLMVRFATHYRLMVRRPPRRCAACGRERPAQCRCNSTA
jgi:hypothetical protein